MGGSMNWLFQFRRHGLVFRRHGFFCRRHGLAIRRLGSTTWFFDDIDFDDLDIFFDDLVFRRVSIDPRFRGGEGEGGVMGRTKGEGGV